MYGFSVRLLVVDDLESLGARASASTVVNNFQSHMGQVTKVQLSRYLVFAI